MENVNEKGLNVLTFPISPQNKIKNGHTHNLLLLFWQISHDSTASESTEEDSDLVGSDITLDFISHWRCC